MLRQNLWQPHMQVRRKEEEIITLTKILCTLEISDLPMKSLKRRDLQFLTSFIAFTVKIKQVLFVKFTFVLRGVFRASN